MIARGMSNKCIARSLGIAPETVKTHAKGILSKLEARTRAQLNKYVRLAATMGIPAESAFSTEPPPFKMECCRVAIGRREASRLGTMRSWRMRSLKVTSISSQYNFERESGRSRVEVRRIPVAMSSNVAV